MSDDANEKGHGATYVEHSIGYETKPSFWGKTKSFLRRFWWMLLIGFVASKLIIILCLVYVGLPNIAQDSVNKSTLEIKTMVVTLPKKDSVHMQQDVLLHSDSIFNPTLDEFPAAVFLENTLPDPKPFATLVLPEVRSSKSTPVNINQTMAITDVGQFTEYCKLVMNSESFRVALRGQTVLHLGKLPSTVVQYNEVLTLKGLNKLKGFDIPSFQLLTPKDGGPNMVGKAYIPNPSIMTLEMGNVTYDLYYNNTLVGTSLLPNLTLKPGNNTVDMRSTVDMKLVTPIPKDGLIHLEIRGNSSIYDGQHLTYYEAALKSNPMSLTLNVAKAMKGPGRR